MSTKATGSPLLVIALDGLRADFVTEQRTPHIWTLAQAGCFSPTGMRSQYPSQTSPNFRSTVTGQTVENHGILDNIMQDIDRGVWFDYFCFLSDDQSTALEPHWYADGNLPIWTALKNQTGAKSGSVYFPFTNVKKQETDFHHHNTLDMYEMNPVNFRSKIDLLISWFTSTENPIKLGLLYLPEPDITSHYNDIFGPEVSNKLKQADELVGYCMKCLADAGLLHRINIILFADHGHTNVRNPEQHVDLLSDHDDSLDLMNEITIVTNHPIGIVAQQGKRLDWDALEKYFKTYAADKPVKVYRKSEFPKNWHYAAHWRVGELLIVPDYKHVALISPQTIEHYCSKQPVYGEHGFDPDFPEMRPFFVAHGPDFKKSYKSRGDFENIDLYPLMCHLLTINPEKCDGDLKRIQHMLKENQSAKL